MKGGGGWDIMQQETELLLCPSPHWLSVPDNTLCCMSTTCFFPDNSKKQYCITRDFWKY
uniref:Uncharacterized protein n=1 Tax=Anguilla anguilla TaxID=7936 RepID=A0A0E9Q2Z0_ANGAN